MGGRIRAQERPLPWSVGSTDRGRGYWQASQASGFSSEQDTASTAV